MAHDLITAFLKARGKPPMGKKNGNPSYAIGCVTVAVGTPALGKDVAYNAEIGAGPQSPNPSPSTP